MILINSKISTFIHLHFLIGNDVEINNINKLLSLKKNYFNSDFKFHNVGDTFKGWRHGKKKLTIASFYRSILGEIIKNVNKIIYLDGDTLIYNDLTEMYKLNMKNLYFRGIHEILSSNYKIKINKSKFICAGVMLMNLKLNQFLRIEIIIFWIKIKKYPKLKIANKIIKIFIWKKI